MLKVKRLSVGQLRTNCYLVFDQSSRETVVVDPGDDADYITQKILDLELKPKQIWATHGHYDHVLAVVELKLAFKIPFLISKKDQFLLKRTRSTAQHFGEHQVAPNPKPDRFLHQSETLKVGESQIKIIATPGHTPGGLSFYLKKEGVVLTGDTIFAQGSIGRTDLKYSSFQDLKKSLKKILNLPEETQIFPGHGETSDVFSEKRHHFKK